MLATRTSQFEPVKIHEQNTGNQSKQQEDQSNQMRIDTFFNPYVHVAAKATDPAFSEGIINYHALSDLMNMQQSDNYPVLTC